MAVRVVLVDDDERFRAMARRALLADGVDVVAEVGNGEDACAAVAQWRPDVVLLDIRLPGIDGLEVARQLRAEDGGPAVILTSTLDAAYGHRVCCERPAPSAFPVTRVRELQRVVALERALQRRRHQLVVAPVLPMN